MIAILTAKVAGIDWLPIPPSATNSHTLSGYYGGAAAAAFDPTWRTTMAERLRLPGGRRRRTSAAWITSQGLSGDTAVVWSYDAWVYALANLQVDMPTPPIYNDEVLLGYGGPVEQYVAEQRPALIIVDAQAQVLFPEIGKLLAGGEYVERVRAATRTPSGSGPTARPAPVTRLSVARGERTARLIGSLLGAVIAVFAGFAVAYTRITPVGASPDELSHLHYINGIADHLRLPPAGEPERQQPPLYYLLGAIVAKLTGDDPRLIRLLSVVARGAHDSHRLRWWRGASSRSGRRWPSEPRPWSRCSPRRSTWQERSTTTTSPGSPAPCSCSPGSS